MCKPQISCQLSTTSQLGTPTINWQPFYEGEKKKNPTSSVKKEDPVERCMLLWSPRWEDWWFEGLHCKSIHGWGTNLRYFFWWNLSTNILLYKYTLGMHVLMKGRGSEPLSRCMHSHKQRPSMSWCTQEK